LSAITITPPLGNIAQLTSESVQKRGGCLSACLPVCLRASMVRAAAAVVQAWFAGLSRLSGLAGLCAAAVQCSAHVRSAETKVPGVKNPATTRSNVARMSATVQRYLCQPLTRQATLIGFLFYFFYFVFIFDPPKLHLPGRYMGQLSAATSDQVSNRTVPLSGNGLIGN
jgi:hypothetical protein